MRPEYHAVVYETAPETEAGVEEGDLTPRVLITGKCLEIVHLEDYEPWY